MMITDKDAFYVFCFHVGEHEETTTTSTILRYKTSLFVSFLMMDDGVGVRCPAKKYKKEPALKVYHMLLGAALEGTMKVML